MTRHPKTVAFWCGRLPHWEVENGRYFVTIHLAGAIPAAGQNRLRRASAQLQQLREDQQDERVRLQRHIFAEIEHWLDRSECNSLLRRTDLARMVADAIDHRQICGHWRVFEYVVMPTHVHLFLEAGSRSLKGLLTDFKRWTGHQSAKLLGTDSSRFWQREWFDHWSRSDQEDNRIIAYIRNNPVKAGLVASYMQWPHASWRADRSQVPPKGSPAVGPVCRTGPDDRPTPALPGRQGLLTNR